MILSGKEKFACHYCILSHFHQVWIGLQEKTIQAEKFFSHEKHFNIFFHTPPHFLGSYVDIAASCIC